MPYKNLEDRREFNKEWRLNNPEKVKESRKKNYKKNYVKKPKKTSEEIKARRKETRRKYEKSVSEKNKKWLAELKSTLKCVLCGFDKHPEALDFHHKNPADKKFEVGRGITRKTLKQVQEEIAKCEVVCANCHRALHAEERLNSMV